MEQIKAIKEYFDPQFQNLKDSLTEIKKHISELYDKHDTNNDRIIKIEESLKSGNNKFGYIEKEINKVQAKCTNTDYDKIKSQVGIMWKIITGIGTIALGLAVKAVWELI